MCLLFWNILLHSDKQTSWFESQQINKGSELYNRILWTGEVSFFLSYSLPIFACTSVHWPEVGCCRKPVIGLVIKAAGLCKTWNIHIPPLSFNLDTCLQVTSSCWFGYGEYLLTHTLAHQLVLMLCSLPDIWQDSLSPVQSVHTCCSHLHASSWRLPLQDSWDFEHFLVGFFLYKNFSSLYQIITT